MKKVNLKLVLCTVALMVTATVGIHAEDWKGVDVSNMSFTGDGQEVYIYNVETGKFMYIGGSWGTHMVVTYRDFGLKFKMDKTGDRYVFTSDVYTQGSGSTTGAYMGLMHGNGTASANGMTVDKQEVYINKEKTMYCYSRFQINRVSGESGDTYTYVLSLDPHEYYNNITEGPFYLSIGDDGFSVVESTDQSKAAKWRFVPIREIDAAVRSNALDVDAFNGMNLDVTYKIDNQGFNRNNDNDWNTSNATYHQYDMNPTNRYRPYDDYYHLSNQDLYGKYYYGLLATANAEGTVSRSFTAPATGLYKVQCQGVSKSGNGVVYAKANDNNAVTSPLNVVADIDSHNTIIANGNDNRWKLGESFYNYEYPAEVYVYAEEGQTIELGIMQNAVYEPTNDLTAFDDFQIKFLGEIFVLDEDYTESTNENEYKTGRDGVTVVLHRTFSKNESGEYYWNTLTLPINMTGTQVKNVFGDNVQLAEATGLDQNNPYIITFQSVDINDGITAGELYLIKPTKEPATPAGQSKTINGKTYNGPLYTLGRRDVPIISDGKIIKNRWPAPNHNDIQYHATYVKKVGGVPASSYVFSKGNMYHTTSDLTIKGFRFWIQDEEASQSSAGAKPFTISISGIDDQLENEGIATSLTEASVGYNDNASVYSLSGQFIGKGRELLSRLPKGIYVVNNKKYLVK